MTLRELTAEQLLRRCKTTHFAFAITADVLELQNVVGYKRSTHWK